MRGSCPFESGKCGKEEEKIQKSEYLEKEKSFLDEINILYGFWRAIIWWKNRNLITNSGHKLFNYVYGNLLSQLWK